MSRSKSFLSGAFLAYVYQGGVMLVGLWLTPFYLRTLGAHDYGVWLVALQVLTFLLLADLGIIAVVPRDVARANGREQADSGESLQVLVGQTIKVVLLQTALIGLLALGIFFFRVGNNPEVRGPIGLILLVLVLTYPLRVCGAVLQGLQDLKFLGRVRIWLWAAATALTVVLLLLGVRFYALAWGWCLQEITGNLIAFLRLRAIRPDLLGRSVWEQAGPFQWRWFGRGMWVSVGQVAFWLVAATDVLIVARAFGPATVVIYSCTAKLILVLQNQPQILAGVALPGLSHMKSSESRENILRATVSLTQAMLLLAGAVFCVVLAINRQFVGLWVGAGYFGGTTLTILMLVVFVGRLIDYTLALALFAFGYEKQTALRCLLDGVVSVTLAAILAPPLGLVGVSLGFLCGCWLVSLPIDFYLFSRELQVSIPEAARPYVPYLWRFALVGGVGLVAMLRIQASNIFVLAVAAGIIGLAYLFLIFPYVRRTALGGYIQDATTNLRMSMGSWVAGWSNNS